MIKNSLIGGLTYSVVSWNLLREVLSCTTIAANAVLGKEKPIYMLGFVCKLGQFENSVSLKTDG